MRNKLSIHKSKCDSCECLRDFTNRMEVSRWFKSSWGEGKIKEKTVDTTTFETEFSHKLETIDFSIGVCVILKRLPSLDCYQRFRGASLEYSRRGLIAELIVHIAQGLRRKMQKNAQIPVVYFVETCPETEYLIPVFCNELQTNYVVLDGKDDLFFPNLERIFWKVHKATLRHQQITLNNKKLF